MNVATLRTALRLRQKSRDAAADDVARCLALFERARSAARAADARIVDEMNAAIGLDAGDGAVEAFAAWLPLGRLAASVADEQAREVEASLTVARAGLSVARAGVEAIERLLSRVAKQADERRARIERVAAEDALGRPSREEVS